MPASYKISLVGAGNVAWNLAKEFENRGHAIQAIHSLHEENAKQLADSLYSATSITESDFREFDSDIIILAVKDDIIEDLSSEIRANKNTVLAHCSGSVPLDALSNYEGPTGVFYPLQTFTKGRKIEFESIPILYESYDSNTESLLKTLASSISKNSQFANSDDRSRIHLSAVFASNFVNHLLSLSGEFLSKNGRELNLLQPLIVETLKKAFQEGPEKSQTGPAKRGDLETIHKHLNMLSEDDELSKVYELLSKSIMEMHSSR